MNKISVTLVTLQGALTFSREFSSFGNLFPKKIGLPEIPYGPKFQKIHQGKGGAHCIVAV